MVRRPFVGLVVAVAATIVLTSAPAESLSAVAKFDRDIIVATNVERAEAKRKGLSQQACLDKFAQAQAERMAKKRKMYHQNLSIVLKKCKAKRVGENVAYGFRSGKANVDAWMDSKGHRANILDKRFRRIGVGVAKRGKTYYTVQVFGRF